KKYAFEGDYLLVRFNWRFRAFFSIIQEGEEDEDKKLNKVREESLVPATAEVLFNVGTGSFFVEYPDAESEEPIFVEYKLPNLQLLYNKYLEPTMWAPVMLVDLSKYKIDQYLNPIIEKITNIQIVVMKPEHNDVLLKLRL